MTMREMKNVFQFGSFVLPQIVKALWQAITILSFLFIPLVMASLRVQDGLFSVLITFVIGVVLVSFYSLVSRVACESLIIVFEIHNRLKSLDQQGRSIVRDMVTLTRNSNELNKLGEQYQETQDEWQLSQVQSLARLTSALEESEPA